jgi:hypothetical protein
MERIKSYFQILPRRTREHNPLHLLALDIFPLHNSADFIQSTSGPEPRYNVDVSREYLGMKNDLVVSFEQLGPNEKYLVNFIMNNPLNLLYLIGGIGVGKSRFCNYFKDLLYKSFVSRNLDNEREPLLFFFDIFEERELFQNLKTPNQFKSAFIDYFSHKIIGEVQRRKYFSIEEEVIDIWETMLNPNQFLTATNSLIDYTRARIHEEDANYEATARTDAQVRRAITNKRKSIRVEILGDERYCLPYLAMLMKYIDKKVFYGTRSSIFIIVDNIDQEPPELTKQIKDLLRQFTIISGIKTIISSRQTTWRQTLLDGLQETPAQVAYTGPEPLQILKTRLEDFEKHPDLYREHFADDSFEKIYDRVAALKELVFSSKIFSSHFRALCGNSIRKALLLGHNLICNSLYDLSQIGFKEKTINESRIKVADVGIGDVCRAIVVGRDGTYEWTPSHFVDNIFQNHDGRSGKYLLKLRILKAVKHYNEYHGITLDNLFFLMQQGFGYESNALINALNEMKQKEKRLIWSDTVRLEFDRNLLKKYGKSNLYLSSGGRGYESILYKSINYIEEVMMDIRVPNLDVNKEWNYSRLEDRFQLLLLFLDLLSETDIKEVSTFVDNLGATEYENTFGEKELVSRKIFESVKQVLNLLLFSGREVEKSKPTNDFNMFRQEHLAKYDDKIVFLSNAEMKVFGSGKKQTVKSFQTA